MNNNFLSLFSLLLLSGSLVCCEKATNIGGLFNIDIQNVHEIVVLENRIDGYVDYYHLTGQEITLFGDELLEISIKTKRCSKYSSDFKISLITDKNTYYVTNDSIGNGERGYCFDVIGDTKPYDIYIKYKNSFTK